MANFKVSALTLTKNKITEQSLIDCIRAFRTKFGNLPEMFATDDAYYNIDVDGKILIVMPGDSSFICNGPIDANPLTSTGSPTEYKMAGWIEAWFAQQTEMVVEVSHVQMTTNTLFKSTRQKDREFTSFLKQETLTGKELPQRFHPFTSFAEEETA